MTTDADRLERHPMNNPEDRTTTHRRVDGSPFVVRTMSDPPPRRECPGDGCNGCQWCRIDANGPDEAVGPCPLEFR